jgi:hypothetical protein
MAGLTGEKLEFTDVTGGRLTNVGYQAGCPLRLMTGFGREAPMRFLRAIGNRNIP